jgi:hypothetical protein
MKIFIIALVLLLLLPFTLALSLHGNQLGLIDYKPNDEIENHYTVTDTTLPLDISINGELSQYVTIEKASDHDFMMYIKFPDEYIEPGMHSFSLNVKEQQDPNWVGITSLLSVNRVFKVKAYAIEKAIDVSMQAQSVNVNSPVQINVWAQSQGYQDIDAVRALISVHQGEKLLQEFTTEERPLPGLEVEKFSVIFETMGLKPGDYWAEAVVFFDGETKKANTTFKIGNMDVSLKDYTKTLEEGFSEFTATISNDWGNELREVYLKLFLDEQEVLQTPTVSISPWQEQELTGIVKIDQKPGKITGKVQVFFEGENKNFPITLEVVEKLSSEELQLQLAQSKKNFIVFSSSVVLLISLGLGIVIIRKKRSAEDF